VILQKWKLSRVDQLSLPVISVADSSRKWHHTICSMRCPQRYTSAPVLKCLTDNSTLVPKFPRS